LNTLLIINNLNKDRNKKIILAIETSCDETAAAVLEVSSSNKLPQVKTISSIISSQTKLHSKMGGVVPEVAARAHVKNILPVVKKALSNAKLIISNVDCIAVTQGPGLIPSLIVGVEFAKSLSMATKKPLIPVNHMLGHLYSPFHGLTNLTTDSLTNLFPSIALIVSGGHTMLVLMTDAYNYKVIGQTLDDAAGEAFDKVAKMLKLPYPGGPEVAKLAKLGNPGLNFPRPMIASKNYNFSFSGLKTAVLYRLKEHTGNDKVWQLKRNDEVINIPTQSFRADVCASFEAAVCDTLISKAINAAIEFKAKSVSLSGGVSANQALRQNLEKNCNDYNIKFLAAPLKLTGDNAEMIGLAAAFMLAKGFKPKNFKTIKADSNLEL
jgi:N6-L-threonylcarbamoyladenine synthase